MEPPEDVDRLSFEEALTELDSLIGRLEAGSIALDDALAAYERGTRLAHHCEALLDRTERRVNALVVGGDGSLHEQPLHVGGEPAVPQDAAAAPAVRPRKAPLDPDDIPF